MIGNDVIDLDLARKESNWLRNGFLNKIFTKHEQILIQKSLNQEVTVWNLWSRKEAVYKIWNRETGLRKFNPIQFECLDLNIEIGKVQFDSIIYFTKTEISHDFVYSIAVSNSENFSKIKTLNTLIKTEKINGNPFYTNSNQQISLISKTHHGRFEKIISIN